MKYIVVYYLKRPMEQCDRFVAKDILVLINNYPINTRNLKYMKI